MAHLVEKAEEISCTFVRSYYRDLVEADTAILTRYYNDQSCLSVATVECDRANQLIVGRNKIGEFFDTLRATLLGGGKKFAVQVRNVDYVAGRDCVSVTCSGTIVSYLKSRVFTQTFVLNPTPYRENSYYISGETLRYISCTDEEVPANHVVVSQAELDQIKAKAATHVDAEEFEAVRSAPVAPATERPARKEREPRERKEREPKADAPADAKPATERPARKEREPRERKEREPKAETSTDAKQEERAPRQPRQTTNKVRIVAVARTVKYDDIKQDAAKIGTVTSFKPDGKDVIIEFAESKSAGTMARLSKKYKATDKLPGLVIKFEF